MLDEQAKLIEDAGGDIAQLHLKFKADRPAEEAIKLKSRETFGKRALRLPRLLRR